MRTDTENIGEWWPSRLVATAKENRLNIWRNPHTSFAKGPVPPGGVPSDGSVGAAQKDAPAR